ncbi:MAG: hypothetical protein ACK4VI_04665 [Alphaproteobacteria bacterium]
MTETHAPTDIYYRSRRNLVILSALLFFSAKFNIELLDNPTIFIFSLNIPKETWAYSASAILLIFKVYMIWQFWTAWFVQNSSMRSFLVNKIDCGLIGLIVAMGLSVFLFSNIFYLIVFIVVFFFVWLIIFLPATHQITNIFDKIFVNREKIILNMLVNNDWVLHFNPSQKTAKKKISFLNNGDIGEGRNANEFNWRVNKGFLEILNLEGKVFSRFSYDANKDRFDHTNDDDTISIRYQQITRSEL